jgi:hypothetical protein
MGIRQENIETPLAVNALGVKKKILMKKAHACAFLLYNKINQKDKREEKI